MLHAEYRAQSETIRSAVENLQAAMQHYTRLMKDSTAGRIDTVLKIGAALAEVFLPFSSMTISYTLQMDPNAKLAFGLAKLAFDVGFSP